MRRTPPQAPSPTPPRAGARLATLLRVADADVLQALRLAGVETEADMLATTDLQLMQLPRVGVGTLRKLRVLKASLQIPEFVQRGPLRVTRSITLELDPAQERRLHTIAAGMEVQPKEWLRLALLEILREGTAPLPRRAQAMAAGEERAAQASTADALIPLGNAAPDLVRALRLAGVLTVAQLANLADWQLLELPGVGNTTVRKVHALARRLGLPIEKSKGRGKKGACYTIRIEVDPP